MILNYSNLFATYGAIISTVLAILEIVKYSKKNNLVLEVNPNMVPYNEIGGVIIVKKPEEKYIVVNCINRGSTQITITHVCIYPHKKSVYKFFKNKKEEVLVNHESIQLSPGFNHLFQIKRTEELEKKFSNNSFDVAVYHSMSSRGVFKKVKIPS